MDDAASIVIVIISFLTAAFTLVAAKKKADVKFKRLDRDDAVDDSVSVKSRASGEGQRMIRPKEEGTPVETVSDSSEVRKSPKIEIDKKKLVIYSEIMKPKFDQ